MGKCFNSLTATKQTKQNGADDMNVRNLTPHAISITGADGSTTTYPASGALARVSVLQAPTGATILGVPVMGNAYGAVTGMDNPNGDTLIVSAMVLGALPKGTPNVFAPDTGPTATRNDKGHIVSVTQLIAP